MDLSLFSVDEIIAEVCSAMRLNRDNLQSGSRTQELDIAQGVIAYYAHFHAGYSFNQIAMALLRTPVLLRHIMYGVVSSGENQVVADLMQRIEQGFCKKIIERNG